MSAALQMPTLMTVDEFSEWDSGDDLRYQLVEGVPLAMAPPKRTHGTIQAELTRLIGNHLLDVGRPCNVVITPGIVPRVRARHNMRVPDLVVTCTPYETDETAVAGAVLVVEILSRSNQGQTWSNVWTYTTIPSVQEILVVQTRSVGASLLRRDPDGGWPEEAEEIVAGELVLDTIGFRAPLADLYRGTPLAARA